MADSIEDSMHLIRYALRGIGGRHREDIAAAGRLALVKAHQAGKRGEDLLRAVQHACRNEFRRELAYDKRVSFTAPHKAGNSSDERTRLELWTAVNALPKRQRRAMVLRFWDGLENAEVAVAMGCSETAIEALVKKATGKLKEKFSAGDCFASSKCVHIVGGDISRPPSADGCPLMEMSA